MSTALAPFQPARQDGRSDRQVVYDAVHGAEPGTLFSYEQLVAELQDGLEAEVERKRVYRAVAQANRTLLREDQRYLGVVKGLGYRVIRSDEHLPVALDKKHTATRALQRARDLLGHVRLDELNESQRALHGAQFIIVGHLLQASEYSRRRLDKQERVIDELRARMTKLEQLELEEEKP